MATRMQQRRGTAAQWISTNAGAGPVLNSGEIGWESDTNKFKIGDGINNWSSLDYFIDGNSTANPAFGSSITFEGATANDFETTVAVTDPTADRTITLPDATGTVVLADGSGNITVSGNLTVSGTTTTINSTTINATTGIVFEGATANDFETTLTVTDPTADRTITFPDDGGTVQLRVTDVSDTEIGYLNGVTSAIQTQLDDKSTASKTETLTNKSISLGSNTVTSTLAQLNTAISDADVASLAGSETLTNKSISLGSNTVTSTLAQLNTAVTDADVASLAGTETLTNKSISLTTNTVTGTKAEFNSAMSDADFATLAGTETLTNKTLTSPTVSGLYISDSSIVIEGSSDNEFETTLTFTNPTTDKTFTFPDSTGIVATQEYVDSTVGNAEVDQSTLAGTGISWNAGASQFDVNTTVIQAKVANVDDTEIGYLNGVTSGIQTQLDAKAALSGATFTGAVSGTDLTLSGNLTVNGTTTNINSTNLVVEDKNIVLADVETPTDTTANGGGITLKGATDKTLNWVDATDAWTSSEDFNLLTGKVYEIAGTSVLSGSTLGSGVTASSLTSVGTITSGTWTGTAIAIANGGTGATTAMTAATALLPDQSSNSGKYLTTDGSGTLSWGTVSGYSAPTIGSTSIASGATVTTIAGLTLSNAILTGTLTAGGGVGTSGQVLQSTGSAVQWSTPAAGAAFSEFMLIGA